MKKICILCLFIMFALAVSGQQLKQFSKENSYNGGFTKYTYYEDVSGKPLFTDYMNINRMDLDFRVWLFEETIKMARETECGL